MNAPPKYKVGQFVLMKGLHADRSEQIQVVGIITRLQPIEYDDKNVAYTYRVYFQGEDRDYLYFENVLDDLVEVIEE